MIDLWNQLFFDPMLNGLIALSALFAGSFGITIVAFTVIVRLLMLPLTLKQLHASKAMSTLQPKIQELQKKHGKDRERLSQETMALYREHGVNPLGCAVPTFLQFPIWIGLYQAIFMALSDRPEGFLELSKHLYPGLDVVQRALPLHNHFLWLNLAAPDQLYILPVLVGGSMWLQQKMMTMPSTDPQQMQMNQMMQVMMPLMFGFFTLQFASGLAIYWVASNLISIAIQYKVTGWGTLNIPGIIGPRTAPTREREAPAPAPQPPTREQPAAGPARPRSARRKK
ncbi:MAG: membrane protein insertase YidC [Chloroflexi bacterium]|nr:membrane protein insertase YidC [Chloroflexota bacterium]